MSNQYITAIMQGNEAFGWVAKENYTWSESGKIATGLIGNPKYVAPTRWKHTKEIAYKLSKERATGKNPTTGIGAQINPPTSTKTAVFMGSIYAHTARIKFKDERLRNIADEFYRDGDSKSGLFAWSLDPKKISAAGDNVVKRFTSELSKLGYKMLPKEESAPGSKERKVYSLLHSMTNSFKSDEIKSNTKMAEQANTNPLAMLNPIEAARMVDKYGVKKIYVEEFPEALKERLDMAGVNIPYCFREPKKCAYMALGGVVLLGITAGTIKYIFR